MDVGMEESVADSSREITPLHYSLWAGGGAALATGIALGVVALGKADGAVDGSADADTAHTMALTADILIATGAAAGVAGLVLYLMQVGVESDPDEEPATGIEITATPSFGPGFAGAALHGSF